MSILQKGIIKSSIHYTLIGDSHFPDFAFPEEIGFLGKWAELHRTYPKKEKPDMFSELIFTNRMKEYLTVFNAQTEERFRTIVKKMKADTETRDALKAQNQTEWVRGVNSIAECAEKIELCEMVYC